MNNKPFDLQKAMAGDPIMLPDYPEDKSEYLTALTRDKEANSFQYIFKMTEPCGHQYILFVSANGESCGENGRPFKRKIVMAPKPVEYWVATGILTCGRSGIFSGEAKMTEQAALEELTNDADIDNATIQTHKITRYE